MTIDVDFLGTNGWYDTKEGNTICTLVRCGEAAIVLDAGNGLHKVGRHLPPGGADGYLLLSHFHLDHIAGLHTLVLLEALRSLVIAGPAGTRRVLGTFLDAPFTVPPSRLPYPVEIRELPAELGTLPFPVQALPLEHSGICLGYRIAFGSRVIAYCPDTGYCENAVRLARDADLLIAECAYVSGESSPRWQHLNPETAARVAVEAGAKRLALTHFDASRYRSASSRKVAERAARAIFPETIAATDGLHLIVDSST